MSSTDDNASSPKQQDKGEFSEDVQNFLDAANPKPAAAVEPPPKAVAGTEEPTPPKSVPKDNATAPAASPAGGEPNLVGTDEFAKWEEQVDELVTERYRRASDRYQGVERRKTPQAEGAGELTPPDFPNLSVVAYDPVAVVSASIVELFENFNIPVVETHAFEDLKIELEQASIQNTFTVVVLGSVNDMDTAAAWVQELRSEHPEKPLVFLSNHDFSQLRRRILHAGASYFILKPDTDSPNLGSLQVVRKRFLDDLLLFVSECHARYIAVHKALFEIE